MASLPAVTILGGRTLPVLAFGNGTALFASDSSAMVLNALQAGYTLIDTAEMYKNSQHVGPVLQTFRQGQQGGNNSKDRARVVAKIGTMKDIYNVALDERKKLGIDCLDALLLHSPPRGEDGKPSNAEAWKTMEQLKDEGVADIIGVSNWLASDIEEVMAGRPKHPIQVNQSEYHPFLAASSKMDTLLATQKKHGIATMVYGALTPLVHHSGPPTRLHNVLEEIAAKEEQQHGWTPATVLFKWASQTATHGGATDGSNDAIIVTTGSKPGRLEGYLSSFVSRRLTQDEIDAITAAGKEAGVKKVRMVEFFDARPE